MKIFAFLTAAAVLTAYFLFGTATNITSPAKARSTQPHLTHLWRMGIALLLLAIYLEISQ